MVPAQDAVECAGCVYNPVHNSVPFFCVLRMCCVPVPGGEVSVVPFLQNKTRMSPRFVGGILVCVLMKCLCGSVSSMLVERLPRDRKPSDACRISGWNFRVWWMIPFRHMPCWQG